MMPRDRMHYSSYVIDIADVAPYDNHDYRFHTWVANFVRPVVQKQLHDKFWFSSYGDHAKLRIYADEADQAELDEAVENELRHPGLSRRVGQDGRPAELSLTLAEDLGSDRFRPRDCPLDLIESRAYLVLSCLDSFCQLLIDTLKSTADGHWFVEGNENRLQNPDGSPFQSLHHLVCLLTQVPTAVWADTKQPPLTGFQASYLAAKGQDVRGTWRRFPVKY